MTERKLHGISDNLVDFRFELAKLINKHCIETLYEGNVPDYILSQVACDAIASFMVSHKSVKDWYGVHLEPGGESYFLTETEEH